MSSNSSAHRLLLQSVGPTDDLYDEVEEQLERAGVAVERVRNTQIERLPLESYDLFVSNTAVSDEVRTRVPSFGGIALSRPQHLLLLEQCGLPVMPWAEARSVRSVAGLFDHWQATRVLLKESGMDSFGGKGVTAFTREAAPEIVAPGHDDIFCAEVCPGDGDLYKAELFGGEVMITWKSTSPPLGELMEGSILKGIAGAYGERELFDFPPAFETRLRACSRQLDKLGYGHCSLDLMRTQEGTFALIEINGGGVATWWTQQFEFYRKRHVDAILNLLERSGRGSVTAGRPATNHGLVTRLNRARRWRRLRQKLCRRRY